MDLENYDFYINNIYKKLIQTELKTAKYKDFEGIANWKEQAAAQDLASGKIFIYL